MILYCYDEKTKEYNKDTFDVGNNIRPANTTDIKPLPEKNGFAIVWDDEWKYVPDFRGKTYWFDKSDIRYNPYGEVMNVLGQLPDGASLLRPYDEQLLIELKNAQDKFNEYNDWLRKHDYISTKLSTNRSKRYEYEEEIEKMEDYSKKINSVRKKLQNIKKQIYGV